MKLAIQIISWCFVAFSVLAMIGAISMVAEQDPEGGLGFILSMFLFVYSGLVLAYTMMQSNQEKQAKAELEREQRQAEIDEAVREALNNQ